MSLQIIRNYYVTNVKNIKFYPPGQDEGQTINKVYFCPNSTDEYLVYTKESDLSSMELKSFFATYSGGQAESFSKNNPPISADGFNNIKFNWTMKCTNGYYGMEHGMQASFKIDLCGGSDDNIIHSGAISEQRLNFYAGGHEFEFSGATSIDISSWSSAQKQNIRLYGKIWDLVPSIQSQEPSDGWKKWLYATATNIIAY